MSSWWLNVREQTRERLMAFGKDTGNVFQALGIWGIFFLLVQIILGLLPLFAMLTLGKTVDAMIGARGIGVVTSDVRDQMAVWLGIIVVTFIAYVFSVRFTGKSGLVGRGLRDSVLFGSLLVYLVTVNQIFLALVFLVTLVVDVVFTASLRIRLMNLFITILAGCSAAQTLIRYTVLRSFTVGEGLTMIAVVVLFVVFLKLRLATSQRAQ